MELTAEQIKTLREGVLPIITSEDDKGEKLDKIVDVVVNLIKEETEENA